MGARWIHFVIRRKWWVVIAWVLIVLAMLPLAIRVTHHLSSSGFDDPSSSAVWATNQLNHLHPAKTPSALLITHLAPNTVRHMGAESHIPASDFHTMTGQQTVFLPGTGVTLPQSNTFRAVLKAHHATLASIDQISIGAKVAHDSSKTLGTSGVLAIPFLAVLLLLVFGSLVSISLPLLVALVGSEVALGIITLIETHITLSVFLTDIVSFLALGVGIDYALFISTRFRQNLDQGQTVETAVADSMVHAGRSVFYSGIAVALAVAALTLGGNAYWRGLALGGAIAVLSVLLATHSLLPALMSILGRKTLWGRLIKARDFGFWKTIGRFVAERPYLALLVGVVLLVPLATLGPRIQMATPANLATMLPQTDALRQAVTVQQRVEGAGSIAPIAVAMKFPTTVTNAATWSEVASVTKKISALADVHNVSSPTSIGLTSAELATSLQHPKLLSQPLSNALRNFTNPTHDPHLVVVFVTARHGPDQPQSAALSKTIDARLPGWLPPGTHAATGGLVPMLQSFNHLTASRLPVIMIGVATVAFVVLAVATGSLLQAFLGVLLDALVALATAGFLYVVVQTGHLGFPATTPDSSITPLIFVLLFGLSMDYEVILLHRIQEPLHHGQSMKEAVRAGVSSTGAMITGAGMIMVIVFISLLISPLAVMKTLALGLTFAVLMDTWIVRSLMVPSITVLLGRLAYWPWGGPKRLGQKSS